MRPTRIVILLLLIFLIFKPHWRWKKYILPYSVVILDDSPSMHLWKNIPNFRKVITSIPIPHHTLKVSAFGKNETYLGNAIKYAEQHFPDASYVILLSDGINSGGTDPVDIAYNSQIPIFAYTWRDSFKDNFIKNIYGETNIWEGETLHIQIQTEGGDSVVLIGKRKRVKKVKGNNTTFSLVPEVGENLYKIFLYPMDSIPENNQAMFSCNVIRKKRIYIVGNAADLDWKYLCRMLNKRGNLIERFIRRGKGFFYLDSLHYKMPDVNNADVLVVVNPDDKIENLVKKALDRGKTVLYFPSKLSYAPYLPFLPGGSEPKQLFLSDTIPPIEYLNPSGILPGAKVIQNINGNPTFAEMRYHKGDIIESSIKGLWRLGLKEGIEFLEEQFNIISTNKRNIRLIYPHMISSGEDMEITIIDKHSNGWIEWEGKKYALRKFLGDTLKGIIQPPIKEGKYTFRIFLEDTAYGAYPFYVMNISEEFRLNYPDTALLAAITNLTGGKLIHNIQEIPKSHGKEKDIYFDALHNPFILTFLIILLGVDWYLWKRNRIKK